VHGLREGVTEKYSVYPKIWVYGNLLINLKGEIMKTKQNIQSFQKSGQFMTLSMALLSVFLVIDTPDSTHRSPMDSMAACHSELGVMKIAINASAWCEERK
jgi:hypothetical protein